MTSRQRNWHCSLLAAAALAVAAGGCSSTPPSPANMSPSDRNAEAYKLSLRAQEAQKAGKPDQAIELYRRALDLQPNMRGVWNNLGLQLMEKQFYLDAVEALKREADNWPEDPVAYSNLGLVYSKAGFADESLRYYQMALDHDAYYLDALRGVAMDSRRLNRSDEKILDILKRGLMVEHDSMWRSVFETERLRVESQIREQKESGRIKTPKS